MSEIRNCAREDIPAVAALFQKTFRNTAGEPPPSLEAYLADIYLDHPHYDPEIAARVHVNNEGRVTGFIGVFPGQFELGGRQLRAAVAGTLMAEDPEGDPMAGARLLRSVIKGPQDVSISETTNLLSLALWERLGGKVVPLFSLDWLRVMRPGGAAVSLLAERFPAAAVLAPAGWLGDWVGGRWTKGRLTPAGPSMRMDVNSNSSESELASAIRELACLTAFHPAWRTDADVVWLLAHAENKERYGPVHRTVVRNPKGDLVGCYVYHGKQGGTGRVLQVLARPGSAEGVVDCLLRDAHDAGLAALRGRVTPQIVNALLKRDCVFVHRASTVMHTADGQIAAAIERGDATITGLAGESWAQLVGGSFA